MKTELIGKAAIRITKQIAFLELKLERMQTKCKHSKKYLTEVPHSDTGNYDPSCDRHWTEYYCSLCDKHWSVDK